MLKHYATHVIDIHGICANKLTLDVETNKIGYLTCVDVFPGDLPWNQIKEEQEE